tara:strand:+ start:1654 stop:2523 length:870 start_codon:yes stop_codon:yes gene_type:complete
VVIQSQKLSASPYDLASTLTCGQAFRWTRWDHTSVGVIDDHWIQVSQQGPSLHVSTTHSSPNWKRIEDYFQVRLDLDNVTRSFPMDSHLREAKRAYRGLRLLKQSPWECLASFILSSNKQIPHIQQIITRLTQRFGTPLEVPPGHEPLASFPTAAHLASVSEADLRKLGMGYRAPFLSEAARRVSDGRLVLQSLFEMPYPEAFASLQTLPGVGPKIANCVLLFAFQKQEAFPIDVWIKRALSTLYFSDASPSPKQLEAFARSYFNPYAGYAQQYLFHYVRNQPRSPQPH